MQGKITMNTPKILLLLGLTVFLAAGCGGKSNGSQAPAAAASSTSTSSDSTAPAPAAVDDDGITARALLEPVMVAARQWQPDAELVLVTTSMAEGPKHAFWFYDVQSRSKGVCTRIRALANGTVENVGTGDACVLMKPVSGGFVDSPVAWEAARAAGFDPGDSAQFGLRFQRDEALSAPRECWVLWSDADDDEAQGVTRGWCVDPVTGQFVVRLSGKGRIEPL